MAAEDRHGPDQELAQVLAGRLLGQHAGLGQHVPHFRAPAALAAMAGQAARWRTGLSAGA